MINLCRIGIHDYEVIQESTKMHLGNQEIRFDADVKFQLKICRNCNKVDTDGGQWNILTDEFLQNKIRENNLKKILK